MTEMSSQAQIKVQEESAWLLGDKVTPTFHSEAARRLHEVRLAAAIFKRRLPLLLHWRRQASTKGQGGTWKWRAGMRAMPTNAITIAADLPHAFAIQHTEVALLRAFLSREIDSILFGNN